MSADDLADFVHRRIGTLKLTKTEVARRARLSRETLNKLLRAEVEQPATPTIVQLAAALDVAPLYLLRMAYSGIAVHSNAQPKTVGDHASFVRDVTFPDNSLVSVNQEFDKVWLLQNTGRVAWVGRHMRCLDEPLIATASGGFTASPFADLMLAPMHRQVPLPATPVGATATVSVRFRAPPYPCTTISRWKMVDAEGDICLPGLTGVWCLVTVTAL